MWESAGLKEWVALDLETTGLDASKNEIIELGAVRFVEGKMTEQFSQLVKPTGQLPREITQLTGITDADLSDAPPLEDVAQDFVDFVGDHPIVGHHISFDLGFLQAAEPFHLPSSGNGKNKSPFDPFKLIGKVHDTNLLSRFLLPCADAYSLTHLIHLYQIHVHSHHRATDDAQATGELFALQMQELVAVPYDQLSQGFRFVENTPSYLANSLRSARNVVNSGYTPSSTGSPGHNPMTGQLQKRNNIFKASGDPRPKEPISDRQTYRFFHETERFKENMPAYEVRPQQADMAVRVMQAIRQDQILTVEAGTGVGKSLAYLVPALLSGKRVILSTYTKTLQDQLFYDEIPRLGRLFKFTFQAALLKGRRNYLCR
ncbi:MAG: exonuclease domain-containing protein, partial [Candidatus Electryoneaceae bacterium]|nr:exonuclease domain-containing protein [Candidatus Electryoneaceae bacterium]